MKYATSSTALPMPCMIVLLVCLIRSPSVSSATVPVGGPKDSPAVAELTHSGPIRLEVTDRGALHPATADSWIQRQELTASDGARGDVFGYSVAVGGNTAIIG